MHLPCRVLCASDAQRFASELALRLAPTKLLQEYRRSVWDLLEPQQQRDILLPLHDSGTLKQMVSEAIAALWSRHHQSVCQPGESLQGSIVGNGTFVPRWRTLSVGT